VTANDVYYGNMTVAKVDKMLAEMKGKKQPEFDAEEQS